MYRLFRNFRLSAAALNYSYIRTFWPETLLVWSGRQNILNTEAFLPLLPTSSRLQNNNWVGPDCRAPSYSFPSVGPRGKGHWRNMAPSVGKKPRNVEWVKWGRGGVVVGELHCRVFVCKLISSSSTLGACHSTTAGGAPDKLAHRLRTNCRGIHKGITFKLASLKRTAEDFCEGRTAWRRVWGVQGHIRPFAGSNAMGHELFHA